MTRPAVEVLAADAHWTSQDRWIRLEIIFHTAAALPPRQRASFLRVACEGDSVLCRDIEQLLGANDGADGRLRRIVAGAVAALGGAAGDA